MENEKLTFNKLNNFDYRQGYRDAVSAIGIYGLEIVEKAFKTECKDLGYKFKSVSDAIVDSEIIKEKNV